MSHEQASAMSRNGTDPTAQPEPEVVPTRLGSPPGVPEAKRRTFSAEYKLRILQEIDRCTEPGQTGALLRTQTRQR